MKFLRLFSKDVSYDVLPDLKKTSFDAENDEEIDINEDVMNTKVSDMSAFWNVCNSVQGVAILAMPYIIKTGGWWSIASLCAIALISNYTGQILMECKYDYSTNEIGQQKRTKTRTSYTEIGEAVWFKYGKLTVITMQIIELLFMATLYPIVAGSILLVLFPDSSMAWWIMVFGFILIPNIFVDKLNSISLISAITIIMTVLVLLLTVCYCFLYPSVWDIKLLDNISKAEFVLSIGAITASYSSQMYLAIIEESMQQPNNIGRVMNWAYATMTMLKIFIGIVGYLTFRENTKEVVCQNITEGIVSLVINIAVLLLACSSYSLPMFSVFEITQQGFQWLMIKNKQHDKEFKLLMFCLRVLIYLSTLFLAEVIPHFCLFLAVIGSISGVCLEFIFPCVFHIALHHSVLPKLTMAIDAFIAIISCLFIPFASYFTISALILAYKNNGKDFWI